MNENDKNSHDEPQKELQNENRNETQTQEPKEKKRRPVPTSIWVIGALMLFFALLGLLCGVMLDSSFYVLFVFAAIFFLIEVFLISHEVMSRTHSKFFACILPAVALLMETVGATAITLSLAIREISLVFFLFGFLCIVAAVICGIVGLTDGKKENRALAHTLSWIAVSIPLIALFVIIGLLACGVAIVRFM